MPQELATTVQLPTKFHLEPNRFKDESTRELGVSRFRHRKRGCNNLLQWMNARNVLAPLLGEVVGCGSCYPNDGRNEMDLQLLNFRLVPKI